LEKDGVKKDISFEVDGICYYWYINTKKIDEKIYLNIWSLNCLFCKPYIDLKEMIIFDGENKINI
jgi:hypothetical protein